MPFASLVGSYSDRIMVVETNVFSSPVVSAAPLLKPFFARHLHFEFGYFQLEMLNSLFQLLKIFEGSFGYFWHLFSSMFFLSITHGKSLSIMSSGYAYVLWSAMSNPNSSASLRALSNPALFITQNSAKPVPAVQAIMDKPPTACIPI